MTFSEAETKMRFLFALRSNGVVNQRVLSAMESVDRSEFVQGIFSDRAHEDLPLPIDCGQTISQPSIVGLMTQALQVEARDRVLEIGTGSGYQAAILSKLARRVYSVERHRRLVKVARELYHKLDITNVTVFLGDGSLGLSEQAPFDRIIVTAAAEDPPSPLLSQLKVGGTMVIPVGRSNLYQDLIRVRKTEDGMEYDELRTVRFVPLLEGIGGNG
ncbi:MAG: protein-L-isoaspartate(D-aspartate) O-methyltransferase [Aestuariivita sp.]|nr:protein-L-isoaspartate(D-aspartate) O-methyltransferase [Aestuariivita sp.]MCY4201952.1 protein-L-isoaspartate(D-aspartate) O-methyltransferase [Aestuariivita sp.]MCY4288837.1 protein-L-isoaspartate(D-aspartate) O-methyltransferase [Aestuariivita sp.]MCY4345242.1 protein-L-isoaspartate(D-aspartate) O-methyltransferase [Aestuariivita sp.]